MGVFQTIWRFIVVPAYPGRMALLIKYNQTCFAYWKFLTLGNSAWDCFGFWFFISFTWNLEYPLELNHNTQKIILPWLNIYNQTTPLGINILWTQVHWENNRHLQDKWLNKGIKVCGLQTWKCNNIVITM